MKTNYVLLNGIMLKGKYYEAVPKTENGCADCSLRDNCGRIMADLCLSVAIKLSDTYCHNALKPVIFRFSQSITDKINNNG